jgi:hypothetical protein
MVSDRWRVLFPPDGAQEHQPAEHRQKDAPAEVDVDAGRFVTRTGTGSIYDNERTDGGVKCLRMAIIYRAAPRLVGKTFEDKTSILFRPGWPLDHPRNPPDLKWASGRRRFKRLFDWHLDFSNVPIYHSINLIAAGKNGSARHPWAGLHQTPYLYFEQDWLPATRLQALSGPLSLSSSFPPRSTAIA